MVIIIFLIHSVYLSPPKQQKLTENSLQNIISSAKPHFKQCWTCKTPGKEGMKTHKKSTLPWNNSRKRRLHLLHMQQVQHGLLISLFHRCSPARQSSYMFHPFFYCTITGQSVPEMKFSKMFPVLALKIRLYSKFRQAKKFRSSGL